MNQEICKNCAAGMFAQCDNLGDTDHACYRYFLDVVGAISGHQPQDDECSDLIDSEDDAA